MLNLDELIGAARARLPRSHRALLEQIGVQDAVIDEWPEGVRALYETLRESPPRTKAIVGAVALWLPGRRVVAYNGPLLTRALTDAELSPQMQELTVNRLAWHEYGHVLSVTRASRDTKRDGPRLFELLPEGLRQAIDFPGSYTTREVFDEVVANVYALMIDRAVQRNDYGLPEFLHPDVAKAFVDVIPWPPDSE